MKLEKGQEDLTLLSEAIFDILENNKLLALSTVFEKKIWTSTLFYSFDKEFNMYFVSEPESQHCQMISKNKVVSGAVYSSNSIWGTDIQGVQFEAIAERVSPASTLIHGASYLERFPVARKFFKSPKDFLSKTASVRLYRLVPQLIQLHDEVTIPEGDPIRRIIF